MSILQKKYHIHNPSDMLLIDDDIRNIETVQAEGFRTVIAPGNGLLGTIEKLVSELEHL